jgi:histidine kinase/DNA gyrase B/HSP90-like ATPase
MPTRTFEIQVQDDHLQRISQVRKPIHAVAELIWNAVDADADRVDVALHDDALGELRGIEVADNGHGIRHTEAETLFSRLGGSWKQGSRRSREKSRLLHGKEGRGRFRAFSLGRVVDWHVCYATDGGLRAYDITMVKDHLRRVQVEDDAPAGVGRHSGVTVMVSELDRVFRSLREPSVTDELAQIVALYLRQYPGIRIYFTGTLIDPRAVEEHAERYDLPDITADDGEVFTVALEIVEWRMQTERRMYFCDGSGFPLDDTAPGIQAGFNFMAYLKSDHFAKLLAENRLEIANLDAPTSKTLDAAKDAMRDHFRRRASERTAGLVEEWQRENVALHKNKAFAQNLTEAPKNAPLDGRSRFRPQ